MASAESLDLSKQLPAVLCNGDDAVRAWRQLATTFLKMQRRTEEIISPHGLALSQFEALVKIGFKPGMIQQELVELLLMTKGNVGALLDRLEGIGLVERQSDPDDRRANRLYLTARGFEVVSAALEQHRAFVRDLFMPLSAGEREQLRQLLKTLEPS